MPNVNFLLVMVLKPAVFMMLVNASPSGNAGTLSF
jgi:hypothetical protein